MITHPRAVPRCCSCATAVPADDPPLAIRRRLGGLQPVAMGPFRDLGRFPEAAGPGRCGIEMRPSGPLPRCSQRIAARPDVRRVQEDAGPLLGGRVVLGSLPGGACVHTADLYTSSRRARYTEEPSL